MLLKYLSIGLMSSSGVGDSIGRPGAVPFSVAHHGQLVFLALGAVFVVWMLCRFVVDLIHRGNLIDPALTLSSIDSASINSIISNDMAALLGTVAGMSTLSLAVSNTLPVDWMRDMEQLKGFPDYNADAPGIPKISDPLFPSGYGLRTVNRTDHNPI